MAASVCENAVPTVAERLPVVIDTGFAEAATVIASCCCAVKPALSVSVTRNKLGPVAVGVPEITPVDAFSCNPVGKAPEVIVQL